MSARKIKGLDFDLLTLISNPLIAQVAEQWLGGAGRGVCGVEGLWADDGVPGPALAPASPGPGHTAAGPAHP